MSANPFNGWRNEGASTQLPPGGTPPLAASQQAGQGQYLTYNSAGNVVLNDGTTPCVVAAGVAWPEKLSQTSSIAGAAYLSVWTGYGGGNPCSTESNDNFTAADTCTVAFGADESTLGKLSNLGGDNRPMLGLVLGLCADGTPRAWVGPVAQAVARGVHMATAFPHAWYSIADAAASTTTAERAIPRAKMHGIVTSIQFTGAAVAADNTDYVTVTIAKRDGAGGSGVTLGTYDSRAANQGAITAFTPASFSLSAVAGALHLLETDVITITVAKGGSGKVLTGDFMVNGKVI